MSLAITRFTNFKCVLLALVIAIATPIGCSRAEEDAARSTPPEGGQQGSIDSRESARGIAMPATLGDVRDGSTSSAALAARPGVTEERFRTAATEYVRVARIVEQRLSAHAISKRQHEALTLQLYDAFAVVPKDPPTEGRCLKAAITMQNLLQQHLHAQGNWSRGAWDSEDLEANAQDQFLQTVRKISEDTAKLTEWYDHPERR